MRVSLTTDHGLKRHQWTSAKLLKHVLLFESETYVCIQHVCIQHVCAQHVCLPGSHAYTYTLHTVSDLKYLLLMGVVVVNQKRCVWIAQHTTFTTPTHYTSPTTP